jgi:aspartyl protease family protein
MAFASTGRSAPSNPTRLTPFALVLLVVFVGEVRVEITVANPRTGERSQSGVALADRGATLTVMPGRILDALGIQGGRRISLVLADGRRQERDVGDATVSLNGDSVPCRVVFGESGDAVLLGLTALEQLGLAVDPVQRRLVPADFLLY